jgi:hypothetical protein
MMLVTDDRDPMTFEETCLLLEGVRNPRIMRDDVEKYLSELVSELVHGVKARDISVVKYIIPLIPELRQMLLDTVNDFFDLPLSEHDRRRKLLAEEADGTGSTIRTTSRCRPNGMRPMRRDMPLLKPPSLDSASTGGNAMPCSSSTTP